MAAIQKLVSSMKLLSFSTPKSLLLATVNNQQKRFVSSESGYRDFETKTPFKDTRNTPPYRYGYDWKLWSGGLKPRNAKGRFKDKPVLGMPRYDRRKAKRWTRERALFGQNDYIDIFGDGRLHPVDTFDGPEWMRGFDGKHEIQRIVRQMEFAKTYLKEMKPKEYHEMQKRLFFLFKKMNRRKPEKFWEKHPEKYWDLLPGRFQSRFDKWNKKFDS